MSLRWVYSWDRSCDYLVLGEESIDTYRKSEADQLSSSTKRHINYLLKYLVYFCLDWYQQVGNVLEQSFSFYFLKIHFIFLKDSVTNLVKI